MANETTEGLSNLPTAQLVRHSRPAREDLEPTRGRVAADAETRTAMFPRTETEGFRIRWNDIQADFVDSPRQSVQKADELVGAIIQRLAEVFSAEQEKLESNWSAGPDVSTEDLRQALRRYRCLFDRLLFL
jgi:hypothetical protein